MVAAVALIAWLYVVWGDDHSDIGIYHRYALAAFSSRHTLPSEYPVLALLPFSLTLLPAADYGVAFVVAMSVLLLISFLIAWRTATPGEARAFILYLLLAGPWVLFGRFDLFPSLAVLLAAIAAGRRRWLAAYALLAVAALLKIYPLVLVPVFLIGQRRSGDGVLRIVRGIGVFAAIAAAGLLVAAILDPAGWLGPLTYAFNRPVESESLPATVLWVISGFRSPGQLAQSFNSVNILAPSAPAVVAVFGAALVVGLAAVYWREAAGRLSLRSASIAALLLLILCNKVLSAQYVLWLLPLVALELGINPLWIGICILTFMEYPALYQFAGLSDQQGATTFAVAFLLTVAARNGLLVIALVQALRRGPEPGLSSVR